MASPDPELKDGFTLPVWMKTKPTRDFEPYARSPPAPEDSFFYIDYAKTGALFGKSTAEQDFGKVLTDKSNELTAAVKVNAVKDTDWASHAKPRQDVLQGIASLDKPASSVGVKSAAGGNDDGFNSELLACGNLSAKLQTISEGGARRGYSVAAPEDAEDAEAPAPDAARLAARRGSRSLPVSPAHSPLSRRKNNYNPYFAPPFVPVEDGVKRSWLSMLLLGYARDSPAAPLAEEEAPPATDNTLRGGTLAESVESLGPSPVHANPAKPASPTNPAKPAKPAARPLYPGTTELRELNFWSPTSM